MLTFILTDASTCPSIKHHSAFGSLCSDMVRPEARIHLTPSSSSAITILIACLERSVIALSSKNKHILVLNASNDSAAGWCDQFISGIRVAMSLGPLNKKWKYTDLTSNIRIWLSSVDNISPAITMLCFRFTMPFIQMDDSTLLWHIRSHRRRVHVCMHSHNTYLHPILSLPY